MLYHVAHSNMRLCQVAHSNIRVYQVSISNMRVRHVAHSNMRGAQAESVMRALRLLNGFKIGQHNELLLKVDSKTQVCNICIHTYIHTMNCSSRLIPRHRYATYVYIHTYIHRYEKDIWPSPCILLYKFIMNHDAHMFRTSYVYKILISPYRWVAQIDHMYTVFTVFMRATLEENHKTFL
jgi:hypothetical protein